MIENLDWMMYKAKLPSGVYVGRGDKLQLICTHKNGLARKLDGVWVTIHRITQQGGIRIMVDGEQFARKVKLDQIQDYRIMTNKE